MHPASPRVFITAAWLGIDAAVYTNPTKTPAGETRDLRLLTEDSNLAPCGVIHPYFQYGAIAGFEPATNH